MKTKFLVRFLNRAAHFEADIELADVLKIAITQGALSSRGAAHIFDAVDPHLHPRLAARGKTPNNRELAANHLKATLCASYIKDIYEDMVQYMAELLEAAARKGIDPNRLIGEHKVEFEANDILTAGTWNNVVKLVSKSVFRKLENEKSTKSLLQKMNTKLNLGVRQATIDAALPYLEIRHLLIHADGKADQAFCDSFPAFGATVDQKIQLDHDVLQKARVAITNLIHEFDQRVVASNVVNANELQP
ncbi:MAG: hypothetical protein NT105_07205 [Verrucomicrobia bacterium]|nr:hypothetical protein [Verrucomicrobiota bacterium]